MIRAGPHDERLEACAFCGVRDCFVVIAGREMFAACRKCKSSGPTENTVDDAVKSWNERVELRRR